jgi:hypothetical protein
MNLGESVLLHRVSRNPGGDFSERSLFVVKNGAGKLVQFCTVSFRAPSARDCVATSYLIFSHQHQPTTKIDTSATRSHRYTRSCRYTHVPTSIPPNQHAPPSNLMSPKFHSSGK